MAIMPPIIMSVPVKLLRASTCIPALEKTPISVLNKAPSPMMFVSITAIPVSIKTHPRVSSAFSLGSIISLSVLLDYLNVIHLNKLSED